MFPFLLALSHALHHFRPVFRLSYKPEDLAHILSLSLSVVCVLCNPTHTFAIHIHAPVHVHHLLFSKC